MNYCSFCGGGIETRIPKGDTRNRYVCNSCGQIHYQNPRVVAGCIVCADESVLLCKRAINPRRGYWTLPAGFLEQNETTTQGAKRETLEEACASVEIVQPYAQFDLAYISQVYVFYLAKLIGGYAPGNESLDVRLFTFDDIPWDKLSFNVVRTTLVSYFTERKNGKFEFRQYDLFTRADWHRHLPNLPRAKQHLH